MKTSQVFKNLGGLYYCPAMIFWCFFIWTAEPATNTAGKPFVLHLLFRVNLSDPSYPCSIKTKGGRVFVFYENNGRTTRSPYIYLSVYIRRIRLIRVLLMQRADLRPPLHLFLVLCARSYTASSSFTWTSIPFSRRVITVNSKIC